MLQYLHIRNLALIEEEEIVFGPGLNLLTGETGAGKSILLGALGLASGKKISKNLLREGTSEGLAEAVFTVESPSLRREFKELDFPVSGENPSELVLSRRVTVERSVCRINGETVSAARLAEAAELLLSVYGQNESATLKQRARQLDMVDSYAGEEMRALLEQLSGAFERLSDAQRALSEASSDETSRKREISFLEYEISEIEEARLSSDEEESLEEAHRRMSHVERLLTAAGEALGCIDGTAMPEIERGLRALYAVQGVDPQLDAVCALLADAEQLFSDGIRELSAYTRETVYDEQALSEMRQRLSRIADLKAKYGRDIPSILSACEEKRRRLEKLQDYEAWIGQLEKTLRQAQQDYDILAEKAHALRVSAAGDFSRVLVQAMQELSFLEPRFEARIFAGQQDGKKGRDEAAFYLSVNPGEPLQLLESVASGGELSRIMLAVKTVQAARGEIDTLIFDEIDAGISGAAALAVAKRLSALSRFHQVICVTHLPQITAMADRHFLIEKCVEEGRTRSAVRPLDEEESLREMARMLGSDTVTEAALSSARELRAVKNTAAEGRRTGG